MHTLALMPLLLTAVYRPFAAVSKPMLQAWAKLRRLRMPRMAQQFANEYGAVAAAQESTATELREEAAAKFKQAKDFIVDECKTAGITEDDLRTPEGEAKIGEETLAKFDGIMSEAKRLRGEYEKAAKTEGRWEGLRENLDYFHGKATGGAKLPWDQVIQFNPSRGKTLGEQFVTTESYRDLLGSGALASNDSSFKTAGVTSMGLLSEVVEVQAEAIKGDQKAIERLSEMRLGMKAASDIIHSGSGGPGDALVIEQFLPGILQLPQRPLTIRELFTPGTATSDTVSYASQTAFDSGAAAVAQATGTGDGAKPQSSIAWTRTTRPVETIATYMAATRQQIADAGQVQSLIDSQGRLMLMLEEEDQLLDGDGVSPNLKGILKESGVQTLAVATGADADAAGLLNLKALRTAKRMTMTGAARVLADAVVMNPNDSEEFDLLTDGNSLFRGGNPVGNFTFNQGIWGLRRVESEAIAAGTVLVGGFAFGATVLERMPITVFTTDSHSDWFIRNLIAVLFEERLGFPIFYPSAFVKVTLNLWAGGT